MRDLVDQILIPSLRRLWEGDDRGDRRNRHHGGEGPEQGSAAEGRDEVRRGAKEDNGEYAERHTHGGKQPMGVRAVSDRAMREAQRAFNRSAGDGVKDRQGREVPDERGG